MRQLRLEHAPVARSKAAFRRRPHALTFAELVVVIGIIAVVGGLILSAVSRTRLSAQSASCLNNLHSISVAFSQYAVDNDSRYPDPLGAGQSWESLLQKYMSQSLIFACPADNEIFPSVGSSYDWRETPDPASSLAGRRLVDVTRSDSVLAFETLPGWHGRHLINAVLVNGSTVVMSDDACATDLHQPLVALSTPSSDPAAR